MNKDQILRSYGTDYKEMTIRLLEKAGLQALLEEKCSSLDLPAEKLRIGLKPNLVTPTPADYGATTHPEVAAGVIEYLKANGYSSITIAEGSWVGDRTKDAFEYCGYNALAKQYDVGLIDTKTDPSDSLTAAGMRFDVCHCVQEFDFLINLPVVKGHCQTSITCALKNMKGLIPDSEKRRFHRLGLHRPIAYLNACITQDFIVADHICGDLTFEEGGNPVVRNCVMAARDPVLFDSFICSLLGHTLNEVPYITLAEELGIGCADLSGLQLITCEGDDSADFFNGQTLFDVSYAVDEVDSCSACYASLVPALQRLKEEGLLERLPVPVSIGQGHQNKSGKIGIGECCRGFEFYVPGCPPEEEDIYRMLKRYINSVHS